MTEIEWILYELSGGDLTKKVFMKKLPVKEIYNYCYLKRLNELNLMLTGISRLEEMKSE